MDVRWLPGMALLAIVGCQCRLTPVLEKSGDCLENADCGACEACVEGWCAAVAARCPAADGGSDAGVPLEDAGRCVLPGNCQGQVATSAFCGNDDAGYSCIQGTCVWECPAPAGPRVCAVDAGTRCLSCAGAASDCPVDCPGHTVYATSVEPGSDCTVWPGTSLAFTDVTVLKTASATCHYSAYQAAGVASLGEIWRLKGGFVAEFPTFGGWCTGRSAFTGVPRTIFSCPRCQFVLQGFE